jgi:phosphoglycerate dehydrogenase-like enzyme
MTEEKHYEFVTLDELLARSDVISLMCPLTPATRHLIGPAGMSSHNVLSVSWLMAKHGTEFEKMKQDVILVNTSRGAVIDESAMVDALNSGKGERNAVNFSGKSELKASHASQYCESPSTSSRTSRKSILAF